MSLPGTNYQSGEGRSPVRVFLTMQDREAVDAIAGRQVNDTIVFQHEVMPSLEEYRSDIARGQTYTRRVWSKHSMSGYLDEEALACARFGLSVQSEKRLNTRYRLRNPHGTRFPSLGYVHFRRFPVCVSRVGFTPSEEVERRCLTIEAIELHPSLRRQGFLNRLLAELKQAGCYALAFSVIANPGFAYHMYRKSLASSQVVVLSNDESVDFEGHISPCPTIAIVLGQPPD